MKTILFTMPTFYYEHPQGIPRLISFLKKRGHNVLQRNINYEFYASALSQAFLSDIYRKRKGRTKVKAFFADMDAAGFIEDVDTARQILNDYFCSLGHDEFLSNINIIRRGLNYLDAAFYPSSHRLDTGISMPYSPYSSKDILKAAGDRKRNIMISFYDRYVSPYLKEEEPEVIGISISHMNQFLPGFTLAKMARDSINSRIVLGGAAVSQLCGFFLKLPRLCRLFDFVVIGPGEETMDTLINALSKGSNVDRVANLMYKVKGRLRVSKYRKYFSIKDAELPEYVEPRPRPIIALETSQNCYWAKCKFCDRGLRYGYTQEDRARYEEKQIGIVFEELKAVKKTYNPLYVRLSDAAVPPQRLKRITDFIRDNGLDIKIFPYVRAEEDFASLSFCRQLAEDGLTAVGFGLESGSEDVNRKYSKGAPLKQTEKILRNFKEAGIHNVMFAMVGFPGEGEKEIADTAAFIQKNLDCIDMLMISPFTLLFNSYIYNNKEEFGIRKISIPRRVDIPRFYDYKCLRVEASANKELAADVIKRYSSPRDSLVFEVLKDKAVMRTRKENEEVFSN